MPDERAVMVAATLHDKGEIEMTAAGNGLRPATSRGAKWRALEPAETVRETALMGRRANPSRTLRRSCQSGPRRKPPSAASICKSITLY